MQKSMQPPLPFSLLLLLHGQSSTSRFNSARRRSRASTLAVIILVRSMSGVWHGWWWGSVSRV